VLDDADPAAVAEGIKVAGLMNGGQACVAQTRILVPRSRYDEFADAFAAAASALVVGDPLDPANQVCECFETTHHATAPSVFQNDASTTTGRYVMVA
jgi:acyl-CoA reductase-like NAD-dependent aldehyde dehydrogenase